MAESTKTFDTMHALRKRGKFRDLSALEARVVLVYVSLADSQTGEARPSLKAMAEDVGCASKPSRVCEALRTLREKGILLPVSDGGGSGHTTVRRLSCPDATGGELPPVLEMKPTAQGGVNAEENRGPDAPGSVDVRARKQGASCPGTGGNLEENRGQFGGKTGGEMPLRFTNTHDVHDHEKKSQAAPAVPPQLDTPGFLEIWNEWQRHRREIKKTLKPTTAKKQLKKLAGWGEAKAIAALNEAMEAGWTGFFHPDRHAGGHARGPGTAGTPLTPRSSVTKIILYGKT